MRDVEREEDLRPRVALFGADGVQDEIALDEGTVKAFGAGEGIEPAGSRGGRVAVEPVQGAVVLREVQGASRDGRPLAKGDRLAWDRAHRLGDAVFAPLLHDHPLRVPCEALPPATAALLDDEADVAHREGRHNGRLVLGLVGFPPALASAMLCLVWMSGEGVGGAELLVLLVFVALAALFGVLLFSGVRSVVLGKGPRLVSAPSMILYRDRRGVVVVPREAVEEIRPRFLRIAEDGIPRIMSVEILYRIGAQGGERRIFLEPAFWWSMPGDLVAWLGAAGGARRSAATGRDSRGETVGGAAPAAEGDASSTGRPATIHPLPTARPRTGMSPFRIAMIAFFALMVHRWVGGDGKARHREAAVRAEEARLAQKRAEARRAAAAQKRKVELARRRARARRAKTTRPTPTRATRRTPTRTGKRGTGKGTGSSQPPRALNWGKSHLGAWSTGDHVAKDDGSYFDLWTFEAEAGSEVTAEISCPVVTPRLFIMRQGSKQMWTGKVVAGEKGVVRLSVKIPVGGKHYVIARGGPKAKPGLYRLRCSRK